MNRSSLALVLISTLLFSAACSLDYEQAQVSEEMSKEIPNSIVKGYTFIDVRPDSRSFKIYAGEARMYQSQARTEMEELFFQELDSEGNIITEGEAERAVIDTETEDVDMYGSIYFASKAEESVIATDYLHWDNQNRRLEGKADGDVLLKKSNGTTIEGKGFSVYVPSRTISFESDVKGVYVQEEEEDQE